MSQHSFQIQETGTLTGLALVQAINAATQALASSNGGAGEPTVKYPNQPWADETANLFKLRNKANNAWLIRGTLSETIVIARSSNTQIGISDFGKIFICTGTFTQTFIAASTLGDGFWCGFRNDGAGVITLDPSESIDNVGSIILNPGETCIVYCDGAVFKTIAKSTTASALAVPVRQVALSGPVDSNGYPNFLPATATGLNLTSQNISSTIPLIVTAANGFSLSGAVDRVSQATSNITWSSLTNSATNYLYVDVNADGTLTPGFVTTKPVYQEGGTYSVTNGAHTCNTVEKVMKAGNGTVANQVYRVFVGEAITSGGNVTSTVAYMYQGRFESPQLTMSLSSVMSASHRLGAQPKEYSAVAICISAQDGYSVGDEVQFFSHQSGAQQQGMNWWCDPVSLGVCVENALGLMNKSSAGLILGANHNSYKIVLRARRGW